MMPSITMPSHIVFGNKPQGLGELWSNMQDVCELLKIEVPHNINKDTSQFRHRRFKAGQALHFPNDVLDNLFLVNCGFLKSSMTDDNGNELVLSFPMKGDLIGVDSIHRLHHQSTTITLSDCDVILIPYSEVVALTEKYVQLGHALLQIMSRELARERYILGAQRTLSAEAKVGRFLCMMGERYAQLGYSSRRFNLRMSRNEIANYLGLAIETVSRVLCVFHRLGVITVNQREVVIIDPDFLRGLLKLSTNRNKPLTDSVKKILKNNGANPNFSMVHVIEQKVSTKTSRGHTMQSV